VALNKEFKEKGICTASREYQYLKIKALDEAGLASKDYEKEFNKIVEKSCTCVGLGTSALLAYDMDTKVMKNKFQEVKVDVFTALNKSEKALQCMTVEIEALAKKRSLQPVVG